MTNRERLAAVLEGDTPDVTPLSYYHWMQPIDSDPAVWARFHEMGLAICEHAHTVQYVEHGTEVGVEETTRNGNRYVVERKTTPVGSLEKVSVNGWRCEDWVKNPKDYAIMKWIVDNTEVRVDPSIFERAEESLGDRGLTIEVPVFRTPLMRINVDLAGTERFCLDIADEVPELLELHDSLDALQMRALEESLETPSRYVKLFENLTVSMLGPNRYRGYLMPMYEKYAERLRTAGKRLMVHYDGALRAIKDDIAVAAFDIIESLTEPPEGDMPYDECRAVWPHKVFWGNINLECYANPPEQLDKLVKAKRERAGKRATAFEISEDLPPNWEQSIPVVLNALEDAG
jgi:hypothetical protein